MYTEIEIDKDNHGYIRYNPEQTRYLFAYNVYSILKVDDKYLYYRDCDKKIHRVDYNVVGYCITIMNDVIIRE